MASYVPNVVIGQHPTEATDLPLNKIDSGTTSAPFVHDSNTLVGIKEDHSSLRPSFVLTKDVEPERSGTIRFGDEVKFRFGNEFPGSLTAQEFIFELPRLSATGSATTDNPGDAGYTGTINGVVAQATDFTFWKPNIGELLVGGLDGYLQAQHGQELLHRYRYWQISLKRRLCDDDIRTSQRSAYLNGIGGTDPIPTNARLFVIVRVWAPWAPDRGENKQKFLETGAYSEQHEYAFRLPSLDELLMYQITDFTTFVPIATRYDANLSRHLPRIFLRQHYVNVPQDQKAAQVAQFQRGITLKCHRVIAEREYEFDANGTQGTQTEHAIDIEAPKLPVSYVVLTWLYKDDLRRAGETAAAADLNPDVSQRRTALVGATQILVRPNPFRFRAPNSMWIQDGSERHTSVTDMHYWLNSVAQGYTTRFPSTPFDGCMVYAPNMMPHADEHSMGFVDFTTFTKPRLHFTLPANDANNLTQRRVVRVMYVFNNAFESKSGQSHMSVFHTMG